MKRTARVLAISLVIMQMLALCFTVNAEEPTERKLKSGSIESFIVTAEADGEYEIHIKVKAEESSTQKIEYGLKIDGEYPFEGAELLETPVLYCDDGDIRTLSNGDQTAPAQKQVEGFITSALKDKTGVRLTPYTVKLSGGVHNVTIENLGDSFSVASVSFVKPENIKSYSEVLAEYSKYKKYDGEQIVYEAEKPLYRSDYSLTAKADTGSADITPKSTQNSIVNYIGGSTWSAPNAELAWEIKVPEDGLYNIGFNFKQNGIIDGNTYRWLKIDGETPFSEAKNVAFNYKTAWQFKNVGDGETDYSFYLTKGKHTLSLAVTLAGVAEIYEELNEYVAEIGDLYLDIVMITGETPDTNRDYELYKQIPEFEAKLDKFTKGLNKMSELLNSKNDINGQLDGAVKNMARVTADMRDHRYESHLYLKSYFSYYQTLSSWLYDIKNMPLSLDKIVISAPESEVKDVKAGFFESVGFSLKRFLISFAGDYAINSLEDKDAESIKLWVNWGRDQVKVLNTLIGESFSPKTGINVKVEQVNASLVQGVISNNSPDLYLHLARTEPVNLAMRGVLYDLSNFSDYDEVMTRFQDSAGMPYMYNGKPYALPDTQGFNVMFVRTDIFEELGLKIPETWEDFLSATSVVQRKNMNSYLPYTRIIAATTVNTGAGGLSIFPTMLIQNGETLYNNELNSTNLSSPISVKTFKFWTDFYTKYKLNPDINFYQRFRVGTTPLGITTYAQYLTFAVAAPEIAGKWDIFELPGVIQEDGSIDRSSAGSGTGCAIMKSSKNKDAAWEFLKWWTSADTQYEYSFNCEAILGQSGRTATANIEALKRLSWEKDSLNTILKQWENVKELPEVPGSYYVSRSIDQAFWAVYNGTASEKEAITDWGKTADTEIKRKIAEYSNED